MKNAGEEVTHLAHDAEKLSVSTEELSRLRFAAQQTGVDAETLSHAMMKLQVEVGKAATEGGDAAKKFSDFGLNVNELIKLSPADQFKAFSDAVAHTGNVNQRAALEVAGLGKSGAELKPLLEQGAAGLDRMAAEADRLGVTMSSVDAANTLRASQAVDKVQEAVGGLEQHIAAGLAPIVEDVGNRIVAWAEDGNRMQHIVNGALQAVAYGAAFVVDGFYILKGAAEFMASGAVGAIALITASFDGLAHVGAWVLEKLFHTKIDTSGIDHATDYLMQKTVDLANAAQKDFGKAFSGDAAGKVFSYFQGIQDTAAKTSQDAIKAHESISTAFVPPDEATENAKKIAAAIGDLHKAVDEFGLSEGAKKLAELKLLGATDAQQKEAAALATQLDTMKAQADIAKELLKLKTDARQAGMDEAGKKVDDLAAKGATAAQIEEAQKLQAQIESVTAAKAEAKRMDEEAKKAKEDSLTPLQKEQDELRKLQTLYESGRISAEEFAGAAAKKEAALHGDEHHTQEAATRGSQEAFKLMNQINNRSHGGDKKERLAEQQLDAQKKANQYILNLTKQLAPKPITHVRLAVA